MLASMGAFARNANQMKYVSILPANTTATTNSAVTSDAVDIAVYKGNAAFVVDFGEGATNDCVNIVTLTHCQTSGGTYSNFVNIAGDSASVTTSNKVSALTIYPCNLDRLHKYVKASYIIHGANSTGSACSVILVAPMKSN